jgi:hypothetical protein
MKNIPKQSKPGPVDFEVTDEEVNQVISLAEDKYDIKLPKADGIKMARLIKKLDWWQNAVSGKASVRPITDKMALDLIDLLRKDTGKEYSLKEARESASVLLTATPFLEKKRIANEIRGILVKHRPIVKDPVVTEKTADLLVKHYKVELAEDQLEQLIQFVTRKLWFEEGLESSMSDCLDDLLKYVDKQSRGKQASGFELHDQIRQTFDQAISKLAEKEIKPLYSK